MKMRNTIHSTLAFSLILLVTLPNTSMAQLPDNKKAETLELLSLLDLDSPGMSRVKSRQNNPSKAAVELLKYYRTRTDVKHPVDRGELKSLRGKYASERDIQVADDALRHYFVGQPAYPAFFCGEDIDWGTRPVPDNEWVWQLNRMTFWDAMARAYWHFGEEKYAQAWARQLVDWVRKNPRDPEHHYAWRSIEAGIRGHRWTGLYQHFLDAPSFTPEVLVTFMLSMNEHARYLMERYRKGSNWGLMEAEGLAFIAFTFPEFKDSEKWKTEAIRRLNAEIDNQVYPDGHQLELALSYHMGCIGWFTRTFQLADMNGLKDAFPASYMEKVEKMCEVPMKLSFPDGRMPQFGDSWTGRPGQHNQRYMEWSKLFGREDFLYLATNGKQGRKPDSTAFALPFSGLYSMRSGWGNDDICLVLKCGPDGGGHCQPDNGTFELYAGGRQLMPDAGSYIYSGDPEGRAWFRQTKVHQTMTLNGKNSAYAPKLLLWKPGNDLDVLVVENKSYENLTHRRAVFFVDKKYFVIVDEAFGEGAGDVSLHFQLAPGEYHIDKKTFLGRTDYPDGWNVLVQTMAQEGMTMAEEEGWVSLEYTKKEPRPAFCYSLPKNQDDKIRFVTVVAPYQGHQPEIKARVVGNPEIGGSGIELQVASQGASRNIAIAY
jgi:heparan-sulfate lyase